MTSEPGFLGLPPEQSDPARAAFFVLGVPYEGTVSYETGTAAGAEAIVRASQQVELYDEELGGEFVGPGVATLPPVAAAPTPAQQMERVYQTALPVMREGTFLLALGGEHSITAPLVRAAVACRGPVSVLQIDAHADLRDSYDGTKHSHASVMRRVLEVTEEICQVGVRSYSREEVQECPAQIARLITPAEVRRGGDWLDRVLARLGPTVYVTVDIDGLDPSIAPGTGTPEPGGLLWEDVTALLRRVCRERHVIAADIVEVRPIPPNHITEFLAARLAYKIIAYTQCRTD